jgi:hypothetical protein
MFSMSLKSVPGTLVSIAPSRIGVAVAATPGLVPQDEEETVPAGAELDADADAEEAEELAEDAGAEELVEDELELQPATTAIATTAAAAAAAGARKWKGLFMCSAFSWLTAN